IAFSCCTASSAVAQMTLGGPQMRASEGVWFQSAPAYDPMAALLSQDVYQTRDGLARLDVRETPLKSSASSVDSLRVSVVRPLSGPGGPLDLRSADVDA